MKILQSSVFKRSVKRLHSNQKRDLDKAVRAILSDTSKGEEKVGDLSGVLVYKFKMVKQLTLLAYEIKDDSLILLALGSHENFYRDLKK
ncbi:MAG: type II toxin-antitoxin system RelE/ParE family toxin [Magnetococcales bacterium]|nr:type II toxin-antitoxin system RelE/ParE family toxin [Magnetococcales bacterium]